MTYPSWTADQEADRADAAETAHWCRVHGITWEECEEYLDADEDRRAELREQAS